MDFRTIAKVNVEGSSPFARSHFDGNPERVPKPSRAPAPSGEALLRQRGRAWQFRGSFFVPTLRHEVIRLHEVGMR